MTAAPEDDAAQKVRKLPAAQQMSVYDQMEAEVSALVTPPLVLVHPAVGMEAWTLTFMPVIEQDQFNTWTRWATSRDGKKQLDNALLNRRVIAETCTGISKDGELLLDEDGDPVTFRDPELVKRYGGRAVDAVKGFIRLDGGVNALAERIVQAAGYGAAVEEGDRPKGP
jgi:hypothetical protein